MNRTFQHTIHVPGALAANMNVRFTMPFDAQLVHVSAVASNDSDATLALGISTDTDGYLAASVIGDSGVPVVKDFGDFDGALLTAAGQLPHVSKGAVFCVVVDFDGAGGTAAQDFTLVLTFTEG